MAKGRPRKKPIKAQDSSKATITLNGDEVIGEGPFDFKTDLPEPKEDLVTPFEAANILNVSESTIKLWFDHGHLTGRGSHGHIRILRGSLFGPRIKKLISGPWG